MRSVSRVLARSLAAPRLARSFSKQADTGLNTADITKYFLELDAATAAAPASDLPIKLSGRSGELVEKLYVSTNKTKGAFDKAVKELESVVGVINKAGLVVDRFFSTTNYSAVECKMVMDLLLTSKEPLTSFKDIKDADVKDLVVDNESNMDTWREARKAIAALNLSPEVRSILETLAAEARLDLVKLTASKASDLRAAAAKTMDTTVTSAVALTKEQQAAVQKALAQYAPAGTTINVNFTLDPSVLGGLLVTMKNQTIDLTASSRLVEVANTRKMA